MESTSVNSTWLMEQTTEPSEVLHLAVRRSLIQTNKVQELMKTLHSNCTCIEHLTADLIATKPVLPWSGNHQLGTTGIQEAPGVTWSCGEASHSTWKIPGHFSRLEQIHISHWSAPLVGIPGKAYSWLHSTCRHPSPLQRLHHPQAIAQGMKWLHTDALVDSSSTRQEETSTTENLYDMKKIHLETCNIQQTTVQGLLCIYNIPLNKICSWTTREQTMNNAAVE